MNLDNFEFSREKQGLTANVVIIDGFSGTGKALISPLLGYIERGEQWQMSNHLDDISALLHIRGVSEKSAEALIRIEIDRIIYNLSIGRNVNHRKTDVTSPYYNGLGEMYERRFRVAEGDEAIERIRKIDPILPLHIHYKFGYTDILFKALKERLKAYILCMRSPFYLIERWYEQDWVNKIPNNDRVNENCIKYKNNEVPWFVYEYCEEYIEANDFEKSILTIYQFFLKSFTMYESLNEYEKRKTLIVPFEDMIVEPRLYIRQICELTESKPKSGFDKMMKNLSLPREGQELTIITMGSMVKKYNNLISPKFLSKLEMLTSEYESFLKKYRSNHKFYN